MSAKTTQLRKARRENGPIARAMSSKEAAEAFSEFAEEAKRFKGVLLTQDRLIIYTSSEKRVGPHGNPYTIFFNDKEVAFVCSDETIVEEDIEGLVSAEKIAAIKRMQRAAA
jgi:hypothetical protein